MINYFLLCFDKSKYSKKELHEPQFMNTYLLHVPSGFCRRPGAEMIVGQGNFLRLTRVAALAGGGGQCSGADWGWWRGGGGGGGQDWSWNSQSWTWHGLDLPLGCTGSCSLGRRCWNQAQAGSVLGWTWQASQTFQSAAQCCCPGNWRESKLCFVPFKSQVWFPTAL